jgi:mRNA interferase RelE/StbE
MPPPARGGSLTRFRIFETNEFIRQLAKLPARDQEDLSAKLTRQVYPVLREQPFAGAQIKKLRGYDPATWRYRIGAYRLFYTVDGSGRIVNILAIESRKDAYK